MLVINVKNYVNWNILIAVYLAQIQTVLLHVVELWPNALKVFEKLTNSNFEIILRLSM